MSKIETKTSLYNSRVIRVWIEYLKDKYPDINIDEILEYSNIQHYEIADEGHWLTQKQVDRWYEKVLELTQNVNVAREAGRYIVNPGSIGHLWQFAFSQVGPSSIYGLVAKAAKYIAVSSSYTFKKINANTVEIIAKPNEGVKEKKYQCENRIGTFEAIALGYTHKLPLIEHPECIFKGGNVCRYIITWKKTYQEVLNNILMFLFLILFSVLGFTYFYDTNLVINLLPIFIIFFLLALIIKNIVKIKELKNSLNILRESADNLIKQVDINYNNLLLTNEVGQAISGQLNIDDVLERVVHIAEKRLDYDRGFILLGNHDKTRLRFRAGYGYSSDIISSFPKNGFHLDEPKSRGIFIISFKEQKPFLINDIDNIKHTLSPRSLEFARKTGTKSFICCPIVNNNESLGIIAVDNVQSKRPLVQSDLTLMMGLSSVIAISIRNAELLESRTRQFNSILHVLAASIDARDFLTAGHSEKVMNYSVGICKELGCSSEYTEMIRIAALLHDYGKIGVPDSILKKSGKLSPKEYQMIQTHSEKTRDILEKVSFEGIFSQVPEIAGSHHEKLDGSGYPYGLRGVEIPLGARIIAVADFFEAITSKRHYRDPMPIDKAMNLLMLEAENNRLDKKIVKAFKLYYSKNFGWNESANCANESELQVTCKNSKQGGLRWSQTYKMKEL